MKIDLQEAHEMVHQYLNDTEEGRHWSERCRDYYDHKQWTPAEVQKLLKRGQAPIIANRFRPKLEGLVGLYNMRKTDPKAYPVNEAHDESGHVVTDGLRYVATNNNFDVTRMDVAEEFFCEGYGGVIMSGREIKKRGGKTEVVIDIRQIPWDRIIFDPHSRHKAFKDATYFGEIIWLSAAEAKFQFGIEAATNGDWDDTTFEDRPTYSDEWFDREKNRVRMAKLFYKAKNKWYMCMFTGSAWVIKPQPSPYLDEEGEPTCPIELVSANINRDNQRYGEARTWIDQQDEINHRRSRFLHSANQKQTHARKGAIEDVQQMKREMQKPDGHVEWQRGEWGKDVGVIPNTELSQAQFELYQDAKAELDAVSLNAQMSGERQEGSLSGVAIGKLQAAGTLELNRQYALLVDWENRVYRQVWARIRQFWNEEKWIRVTDDQDKLRYVGFNSQVTIADKANEIMEDDTQPIELRQQVAQQVQYMGETSPEMLEQVIEVKNDVAELDMDIMIDQSYDTINVQEEQFQLIAQLAANTNEIDIISLIKLSNLRGKDELIEEIEERRSSMMESQGNVEQLQSEREQIQLQREQVGLQKDIADLEERGLVVQKEITDIENTQADSLNKRTQAIQRQAETELMMEEPSRVTSIAV